jgi:hypothetical protein
VTIDDINSALTQLPKPSPNAIKMSTATLKAAKAELTAYKLPAPELGAPTFNGMQIIIDETVPLYAYVLGFYSKGVFTAA